jgi:asparagine synthase (glutamine-hydrolysing)
MATEIPGPGAASGAAVRDADGRRIDEREVRPRLAGHLFPAGDPIPGWPGWAPTADGVVATTGSVLARYPARRPSASAAREGVSVCVAGTPWWSDAALAGESAASGVAAAVLSAWTRYGERLLSHLHGPFAVAIVDSRAGAVMLATDRFAIQPLCWTRVAANGGGLVFATTLGDVAAHPLVDTAVDPQSIYDYLYFHVVPAPRTIFEGLHKLRAGERLLWQGGEADVRRYWEPDFAASQRHTADARALHGALHDALGTAVSRADGHHPEQVACFLSGGLDSSTVCGALARSRGAGHGVHAYSMGFDAEGFDETEYARTAARHFGLALHERYVDPDEIADAMMLVANWYDEPFGNSSAVPAYLCARTAAEAGITRMLAGDGGDELFAGNSRYVRQQLFAYYDRLPAALRSLLPGLMLLNREGESPLGSVPGLGKLTSYVAQARPGMPARYDSYNYLLRYGPERVLTPELLSEVDTANPLALMREVWERAPSEDLLSRMLYLDWQFTLADNDLRKVSEMCAAAGVEVRYPMLDEAVLDVALRVPPNRLISRHRLRHFFKEAMAGFLPGEILHKEKHGFGLPFGIWLARSERLRELVYPTLAAARTRGMVNPAFIDAMVTAQREGNAYYFGGMVWVIVMLELWLQRHVDPV